MQNKSAPICFMSSIGRLTSYCGVLLAFGLLALCLRSGKLECPSEDVSDLIDLRGDAAFTRREDSTMIA